MKVQNINLKREKPEILYKEVEKIQFQQNYKPVNINLFSYYTIQTNCVTN